MQQSSTTVQTLYLLNVVTILYVLYAFRILVKPWDYTRSFLDHNNNVDLHRSVSPTYTCDVDDSSSQWNTELMLYETGDVCNLGKVGAYFLLAYIPIVTAVTHSILVRTDNAVSRKQQLKVIVILHSVIMGIIFLASFLNPYLLLRSVPIYLIQSAVLVGIAKEMNDATV